MLIERLQLKNFKMFREADFVDIPALAVFVGVNGSGKTTLFDAFDFLRDSLQRGVEFALDWRGGFRELRTRGADEAIEIEMTFRAELGGAARPITYLLQVGEENHKPRIERETLSYPFGEAGARVNVLDFSMGEGKYITNETEVLKGRQPEWDQGTLEEPDISAIAGIGQFGRYEAIGVMRRFIQNWHLSDFFNDAARRPVAAGDHKHLAEIGGNLAGVIGFMKDNHPEAFGRMLKKMARRVPGFNDAVAEKISDSHTRLKFRDAKWEEPFDARHMSDGTLKMLGILTLLEDPEPRSLLCVEEPENQLYPYLLDELMEDFRLYAQRGNGQVLTTTHSYEMLNAAKLEEVFWLVKRDGISEIRRARDDKTVAAMVREEGEKMGDLWRDGYLEGARPQ